MKKLHLLVGVTVIIIFVLSGQYMKDFVPNIPEERSMERMSWLAGHIYMMFAGMGHLLLGVYLHDLANTRLQLLQKTGSILSLAGAAALVYAFITEAGSAGFERGFTTIGCLAFFFGGLMIAGAGWWQARQDHD